MTREEAIHILDTLKPTNTTSAYDGYIVGKAITMAIKALRQTDKIKALGEELRKVREGIKDENVLIGFNMAVAICNKYLGESEDKSGKEQDNGNDW